MSFADHIGGLMPPPANQGSAAPGANIPPPLPPRPNAVVVSPPAEDDSGTESGEDDSAVQGAEDGNFGASSSTVNLLSTKDEEELTEVQLRELYDDEEIDRFLHLFSTYVREVRATDSLSSTSNVARAASASAPALSDTLSTSGNAPPAPTTSESWTGTRSLSERIAVDFFLPLLPPPRPPPPEFSLSRLKQTSQRLYVALEPFYSMLLLPMLRLATWKDAKRSFAYCALYWILWYHGLLFSGLMLCLLYPLLRRRLHPYPSLDELRAHRNRIDRSNTFGSMLATRLAVSPSLGVKDMWDLFRDYQHTRKLKKKAKEGRKNELNEDDRNASDSASIHSVATEKPEANHEVEDPTANVEEEDLKRLGLYLLSEAADLLERVKNIFLWRNPSASVFYGTVLFGWFLLGLLPAKYLVRFVGFLAGGFFWHVLPVLAAIPPSERSRIPAPLSSVPTDAEYAMELISQRVARGLPVRPKRRKGRRRSSEASVISVAGAGEHRKREGSTSSSIDWNKWGDRLASTKERTSEVKKILKDGQWKQAENWKAALHPMTSKEVALQNASEARIETHTFPAQLKQRPGLVTLTPSMIFFTPLLSSSATLSIPLADVTGVKKSSLMKGIEIHYAETGPDGSREDKEVKFLFVGSRDDLFARLVSYGGKRWTRV
ncbi:hypothetical protein GY45DRAFT_1317167 [Cubamyces sp. BRFM 1775]|nr:hypothetical protein GY45DRAFT_1317167 [Cubamyces sp. BRFM 1775]